MGFNALRRSSEGLASATSANGVTRTGATLSTEQLGKTGMLVQADATIVTGSVAATFTAQVSMDGTNWYDYKPSNNASNVATAAGAGTHALALSIDAGVIAWNFFRCNSVLAGAATAGGDVTAVTYRWTADTFGL